MGQCPITWSIAETSQISFKNLWSSAELSKLEAVEFFKIRLDNSEEGGFDFSSLVGKTS